MYKPLTDEELQRGHEWPTCEVLVEQARRANALAAAVKAYRDRIETDAFEPDWALELDNAVDQALAAYLGEGPDSEGS